MLFPYTQEPHFLDHFPLKSIHERGIRNWPKSDTTFRCWHARLVKHAPTKAIFDRVGISDLLKIVRHSPTYEPMLFPITFSFWSFEYNIFIFSLGPMSITFRDVGALVNLLPLG